MEQSPKQETQSMCKYFPREVTFLALEKKGELISVTTKPEHDDRNHGKVTPKGDHVLYADHLFLIIFESFPLPLSLIPTTHCSKPQ